jgi:molybdenum cofactor cytidylyltransferase
MKHTGIVILAAGTSSRFGATKQLASFNGKTLLQHVIDAADAAGAAPIVVVIGVKAIEVKASIEDRKVAIVLNKDWKEGMSSSIAAGVAAIKELNNKIKNIIIAVCDQPFVTEEIFEQLDQIQKETGKSIVACAYANTIGTPVLFTGKYIGYLIELTGDKGAKQLIKNHPEDVATLDFPKGAVDIDTQEDLDKFQDEQ